VLHFISYLSDQAKHIHMCNPIDSVSKVILSDVFTVLTVYLVDLISTKSLFDVYLCFQLDLKYLIMQQFHGKEIKRNRFNRRLE
jgi:hypothetical protein